MNSLAVGIGLKNRRKRAEKKDKKMEERIRGLEEKKEEVKILKRSQNQRSLLLKAKIQR
jgi:hypothetical protein